MSAGAFVVSKYEADYAASIHPIKVQPETLALTIAGTANAAPAGAVSNPIRAKVGKGKREAGLGPRMVSLKFTGTVPDGYTGQSVRLPLLTKAIAAKAVEGATGEYLGSTVVVSGSLSAEDIN